MAVGTTAAHLPSGSSTSSLIGASSSLGADGVGPGSSPAVGAGIDSAASPPANGFASSRPPPAGRRDRCTSGCASSSSEILRCCASRKRWSAATRARTRCRSSRNRSVPCTRSNDRDTDHAPAPDDSRSAPSVKSASASSSRPSRSAARPRKYHARIPDPRGDRVGEDGKTPVVVAGEVRVHTRPIRGCHWSRLGRHLGHRRSCGCESACDSDDGGHGDSSQEHPAEVPSTARCSRPSHHVHSRCHHAPALCHQILCIDIVLHPYPGEPWEGGSAQLLRPDAHGNGPPARRVAAAGRFHRADAWLRNVASARKTAGRTSCTSMR